jgi:hypothetical protein
MEWIKFNCLSEAPWRNNLLLYMDGSFYLYSPKYFPPAAPDEFCVVSRICSPNAKNGCCRNFAYGDMDDFKEKYWIKLPKEPNEIKRNDD